MDNIVLVMLACAIAIIILYSVLQGYFEGVTALKYNSNLNVQQASIDVSKPKSKNFAYGMWININKLSVDGASKLSVDDIILSRPSEIKLFIHNGNLMIADSFEVVRNFPLQKWVYITVSVKENTISKKSIIDTYIDGKLVKSFESMSVISPTDNSLTLDQFDAKLIGFKRWTYPLNPVMVSDEYNASNMKKLVGNYNLDISILKNEVLAKRFSVF
jgi:hypothetical protein